MQDLIWYACYGSNMLEERFLHYINGGTPIGSTKFHQGCIDKTGPVDNEEFYITGELYFAEISKSWEDGGVCFLRLDSDTNHQILGRMYLISKEQFLEVVQQENNMKDVPRIDFQRSITEGESIFWKGWYGRLLYLGERCGHPIFTITKLGVSKLINKPSKAYLQIVAKGIQQTFKNLGNEEIIDYLISKDGVRNNYTRDEISEILVASYEQ